MDFYINDKTREYIKSKGGHVILALELEPAGGG